MNGQKPLKMGQHTTVVTSPVIFCDQDDDDDVANTGVDKLTTQPKVNVVCSKVHQLVQVFVGGFAAALITAHTLGFFFPSHRRCINFFHTFTRYLDKKIKKKKEVCSFFVNPALRWILVISRFKEQRALRN